MFRKILLGAAALTLCTTTPAMARGFLEEMAKQAAARAIQKGASAAVDGAISSAKKPRANKTQPAAAPTTGPAAAPAAQTPGVSNEDPFAPAGSSRPAPSAPAAVTPQPISNTGSSSLWPTNAGDNLRSPGEFRFDPSVAAEKKAFDDFGAVRCTACEGGKDFDSWATHKLDMVGNGRFETTLGKLDVGQSLTWKGAESDGKIVVTSATPVAGFECKQLQWSLKKRKTGASATRQGLLCKNKQGQWLQAA